jgi:hypothetical protein
VFNSYSTITEYRLNPDVVLQSNSLWQQVADGGNCALTIDNSANCGHADYQWHVGLSIAGCVCIAIAESTGVD